MGQYTFARLAILSLMIHSQAKTKSMNIKFTRLLVLLISMSNAYAQVPYLVKDVHTSSEFNTGPKSLTNVNGTLFFAGSDQYYGNLLCYQQRT